MVTSCARDCGDEEENAPVYGQLSCPKISTSPQEDRDMRPLESVGVRSAQKCSTFGEGWAW